VQAVQLLEHTAAGLEVTFKVRWRFGFVVWVKAPAAGLEVTFKVRWRFGFVVWVKAPVCVAEGLAVSFVVSFAVC